MYQGFDSHGNAVKCGRHGSARGVLLTAAGPARKQKWSWPARSLGSSFFKARWNQTLYLYGGTAKLVGDDSTLRCLNRDGYGLSVSGAGAKALSRG
jgi:hypothetical protein